MCPHRPYVFGPHGERKSLGQRMREQADSALTRRAYLDQVEFVNSRVDVLVDQILARRDRRSIIILQGDHGPRNEAPMDHPTPRSLREGSAILNAYYLPDGERGWYDSISPVNSFRLVFRNYFGLDYPALADRSFHNWSKHPYQWIALGGPERASDSTIAGPR
jgi:arylsulfatase A-like enzyme